MTNHIPTQPPNSFRVTLSLSAPAPRLDSVLMEALRNQDQNMTLKRMTRTQFKKMFNEKKILIKGQIARPASSISSGLTYVDILGFS